jgi:hypothetical protein
MKRRAFVKLLAGAAIAAPFYAKAHAATNHRLAIDSWGGLRSPWKVHP